MVCTTAHVWPPGARSLADEFWLMKEARVRNPEIKLYGLPWAFPGWLDPRSTATSKADANQFMAESNLTQIAEYVAAWVRGARDHHGLHIDYVGKWNEKVTLHRLA